MDFPLNSSLILAVTVGLWLLWVAPYVLRRPASALPEALPAVLSAPASTAIRSSISADGLSQQGNIMYNESTARSGPASGTVSAAPSGASARMQPREAQPAFRIRYGRASLALAGSLAVVSLVIGLPLAVFGAASWWLPAAAAALAAAAVASLRTVAVRDRRRRVDAAFRAAMGAGSGRPGVGSQPAPAAVPAPPAAAPRYRETVLFDAETTPGTAAQADDAGAASVTTAPGAPDRRLTAAELRTAALAVAATTAPQAPAGPPKTSTTPWEPVEVPKPTYVEAPVAQRAAPEPIVLPEAPKPSARTSIRAGAVAAAAESAAAEAAPATGKINLDDVLQRRRA